jgi:hypothetical protein
MVQLPGARRKVAASVENSRLASSTSPLHSPEAHAGTSPNPAGSGETPSPPAAPAPSFGIYSFTLGKIAARALPLDARIV